MFDGEDLVDQQREGPSAWSEKSSILQSWIIFITLYHGLKFSRGSRYWGSVVLRFGYSTVWTEVCSWGISFCIEVVRKRAEGLCFQDQRGISDRGLYRQRRKNSAQKVSRRRKGSSYLWGHSMSGVSNKVLFATEGPA